MSEGRPTPSPTDLAWEMRERARTIASRSIAPRAAEFERNECIPDDVFVELARAGLFGVAIPASLGGAGAGTVAYALALIEVAEACASTSVAMAVTNMVAEVIVRFGTDAQRTRFVPRLMHGGLGAFALSEAEAGSDPAAMRTTATREGDVFVIDGAKQWITSGDAAEVIVVWARTGAPGAKGISAFLVPRGTPGLTVERLEKKMGLRASHTAALRFDRMRLPEDALLGSEGQGFAIAMMALDGGRIGIGAQAIGMGEAAYRRLSSHVAGLGRSSTRLRLAIDEARMQLDAATLLVFRAAAAKERLEPFRREASMAKLFATEAACRTVDEAYRALGSVDSGPERAVERLVRDVRVTTIYEGTSEIQRLVIARDILKAARELP